MISNFLDIIILLGAVQGFITSSLLFYKASINSANKYLGWILLLVSLACLNTYLLEVLTIESVILGILSYVIPLVIIMPIGPLVYNYTLAFTKSKPTKLPTLHFYPILLDLIPSILSIFFFLGLIFGVFEGKQIHSLDAFIDSYNKYVDIPRWISVTYYSVLAYQKIKTTSLNNQWIFHFVLSFLLFVAIWLVHLVPYLIPAISNALLANFSWYPVYVPLVILIYWLGFNGVLQSTKKLPKPPANSEEYLRLLVYAMETDKLYRDAALRLEHLVEHTGISQKNISATLNQSLQKSFNEFVNEFRIEEVKQRLADDSYSHLTITGIALESGFNSQATFQRTFKKMMNETPNAYRKRMKELLDSN